MLLDKFTYCPCCGSEDFAINDERSKHCGKCGFTYYINASGAYVAIIYNKKGEMLVVRRNRKPAKGTLDLPGGFADPGETAEQGVAREVLEETGLVVTSSTYLFSKPNRYEFSGMIIPTLDLFFECKTSDEGMLSAQDDATDARWMAPEDINPEEFGLDSIRVGIMEYLKRIKNKE